MKEHTPRSAPAGQLVDVDGLQVRVSVRPGSPELTPLLLCNGIGGAIELWEPFLDALGDHPTVAFDAPGAGESSVPPYPPTMAGVARVVVHLLDRLGLPVVDVLGLSWGGALAQELAYRYRRRVRRLVLAAAAAGGAMVPGDPRTMGILLTPARYRSPRYLDRVAPALYGPDILAQPDLLARQRRARLSRPPSRRGYVYQMLALGRFASILWLHRLSQPTLVLAGDADSLVPLVNARLLAARIPGARLEVVPGGGHLFLVTRAPTMARLVTGFLNEP